jgi:mono/diheme cytochrome c family protein
MISVPRFLIFTGAILALLLLLPPVVIARVRATPSPGRQVHIFFDMDMQPKYKAQAPNPIFADGRAMRPFVAGTVPAGDAGLDGHLREGSIDGEWADTLPPGLTATEAFLIRGQERFNIYCALCHGYAGYGDGMVNQRAMALMNHAEGPVQGTTWVAAKSVHDETVRVQPIGQIYHTITHGIRNMAGYASQITVEDRWAIAAYVKALQISQNASLNDVPPERRGGLKSAGADADSEAVINRGTASR